MKRQKEALGAQIEVTEGIEPKEMWLNDLKEFEEKWMLEMRKRQAEEPPAIVNPI